jgi:hypothetical protein
MYAEYSLSAAPRNVDRVLPGNIGDGISSEANVNTRKNTTSIIAPRTVAHLQQVFLVCGARSNNMYGIVIFNKPSCLLVQHKY